MGKQREMLGSRIGFLLIAAGCAIGLGNVWRFPFITGAYGGAWFLLIFIVCQLMILPCMVLEFAVGRASRRNMGLALKTLQPKGTKWSLFGWVPLVGSYCLLCFYTVVCGWMILYCYHMIAGTFAGVTPDQVKGIFGGMLGSPGTQLLGMSITIAIGSIVCISGLQKGVERVVKVMMLGLLAVLVVLVVHSLSLPGASKGLAFYLMPDASKIAEKGFFFICSAALNQAFFTLSIGIGAMCIFGSYMAKDRSLAGEAVLVTCLDFFVALMSGFIIFPACFSFGVEPGAGPGLIFVTLPNVFASMAGGQIWGALFFVFMSCAALTTVIAVFENMVSYCMDCFGWHRGPATLVNTVALWLLSVPCALGFNLWSGFQPFGPGSGVLDLEDFIISNNILPLGGLLFTLFCTLDCGWGWNNFLKEANTGTGLRIHPALRFYLRWILPAVILFLFVMGYIDKFSK